MCSRDRRDRPLDPALVRAVDAALADALAALREALLREVAALTSRGPRPPRSRAGRRPGDDAPVDEVTAMRARRLLQRHGFKP